MGVSTGPGQTDRTETFLSESSIRRVSKKPYKMVNENKVKQNGQTNREMSQVKNIHIQHTLRDIQSDRNYTSCIMT